MGELQTLSRGDIARLAMAYAPPERAKPVPVPVTDGPRRPRGRPRGAGPHVDVDMGVGREYGYRDPRRLSPITVRPHRWMPEVPSGEQRQVGLEMARIRLAAGVPQAAVAAVLGVGDKAVRLWEVGSHVQPSVVRAHWAEACTEAARRRARAGRGGPA